MSVRQRRGKKIQPQQHPPTAAKPTMTTTDHPCKILQQILPLRSSHTRKTKRKHSKWRENIYSVSAFMAVFMCSLVHGPLSECLFEIQGLQYRSSSTRRRTCHFRNAGPGDCAKWFHAWIHGYSVGGIIRLFLPHYVIHRVRFSSWQYLCANALVPLLICVIFSNQNRKKHCIPKLIPRYGYLLDELDEEGNPKERSFPIAIILNVIISAAYWLMKSGMEQCDANVDTVENCRGSWGRRRRRMGRWKRLRMLPRLIKRRVLKRNEGEVGCGW